MKIVYKQLLNYLYKFSFSFWQKLGFHVTLNHYYQPIPDTRILKDSIWSSNTEAVGVDFNEKKQLELLSVFISNYKNEYSQLPETKTAIPSEYYTKNNSFGSVDGEVLYSMVRHFKPERVYEIGSGFSTFLTAQAVLKNQKENHNCELIAFEPYPNEILRAGFPGLSKLVAVKVEELPYTTFNSLQENDILFIDSSHVLRIGNDVQYEYLEILPRLNKGVIVHVHDIFLPAEYPQKWVLKDYRFWTEQYLLQAFLTFNNSFEVLWAGSYMNIKHSHQLKTAFSSFKRNDTWPGSFWMKKIK
jgi:hypothetical protein